MDVQLLKDTQLFVICINTNSLFRVIIKHCYPKLEPKDEKSSCPCYIIFPYVYYC